MTRSWAFLLAAVGLIACGGRGERASSRPSAPPASPASSDSLALRLPNGISIWFTDSRSDTDSAGGPCVERVMQIRHDSLRIAIPLLYTGAVPTPVDDTTIDANLWHHCQPGDRYLVDLRTGRPRRIPR